MGALYCGWSNRQISSTWATLMKLFPERDVSFKAGFTDRVTRHLAPPCGLLWRVKYSLGGSPKLLNFKVRGFEPKLPLPARANFSGYAYDVLSAINIDQREERLPLAVIDTAEQ
jgi:hypothetical protein